MYKLKICKKNLNKKQIKSMQNVQDKFTCAFVYWARNSFVINTFHVVYRRKLWRISKTFRWLDRDFPDLRMKFDMRWMKNKKVSAGSWMACKTNLFRVLICISNLKLQKLCEKSDIFEYQTKTQNSVGESFIRFDTNSSTNFIEMILQLSEKRGIFDLSKMSKTVRDVSKIAKD